LLFCCAGLACAGAELLGCLVGSDLSTLGGGEEGLDSLAGAACSLAGWGAGLDSLAGAACSLAGWGAGLDSLAGAACCLAGWGAGLDSLAGAACSLAGCGAGLDSLAGAACSLAGWGAGLDSLAGVACSLAGWGAGLDSLTGVGVDSTLEGLVAGVVLSGALLAGAVLSGVVLSGVLSMVRVLFSLPAGVLVSLVGRTSGVSLCGVPGVSTDWGLLSLLMFSLSARRGASVDSTLPRLFSVALVLLFSVSEPVTFSRPRSLSVPRLTPSLPADLPSPPEGAISLSLLVVLLVLSLASRAGLYLAGTLVPASLRGDNSRRSG